MLSTQHHSRTQSPSYARCDEGLWPNQHDLFSKLRLCLNCKTFENEGYGLNLKFSKIIESNGLTREAGRAGVEIKKKRSPDLD